MDFLQYKDIQFYAGKPTTARAEELIWDGLDYSLTVREDDSGLHAIMTGGNCEWRTWIDPASFVDGVNAALEDACDLGRTVDWSNDE